MNLQKMNFPKFSTDSFVFSEASCKYSGFVQKGIDFVENFDIKNPGIWKRFVEQYRLRSDTADFGWRGEY